MSCISYIASARPLPTGTWIKPPLREYFSYAAYAKSPDFQAMWEKYVADWEKRDRPRPFQTPAEKVERYRRYKGRIAVYDSQESESFIIVEPFEEWEFTPGKSVTRKALRTRLRLPEVYFCTSGGEALEHYLCWAMQPGERVEFFTCWNGEEKKPLKNPIREIDLQTFVDGEYTKVCAEGNTKKIYLAPREPQPLPLVLERKPCLLTIHLDVGLEIWDRDEMQRQDRERTNHE